MKKSIDVIIKPDGSVEIEASGFSGGECLSATKPLEDWLGGEVGPRTIKPEFQHRGAAVAVKQGGGRG